jgi:microsomal dipeptidase-like Zn-dependent dipeptidase
VALPPGRRAYPAAVFARRLAGIGTAVAALVLAVAPPAGASARLANHCFVLASHSRLVTGRDGGYRSAAVEKRRAAHFHLKPTAFDRYMLYDRGRRVLAAAAGGKVVRSASPGPAAEWRIRRGTLRSTAGGRSLAVAPKTHAVVTAAKATRFRLVRARGCRRFPEAAVDVRGRPFRGTLLGYADPHLHVTADLRAGGRVIYGRNFHRFGIAEALGHDADYHGSDGSLDVTGNLLRSGTPTGTHDTHGWPTFAGWPTYDTYTHQQVYYRWLERAWKGGMRLVTAQLVEDQPLCETEPLHSHSCDETATVRLEVRRLRELRDYVDAQAGGPGHGWFRLVYSPASARRAIERGKLAVLIGVESSNPFGCSERLGVPQCDRADIDRGIALYHRLGIRSVFVAHWVDNALSGAALEGGDKGQFIAALQLRQTGMPFAAGACPHPQQGEELTPGGGRQCNVRGLTQLGEYAVRRMMDRHMLIEVDHMSEWARQRILTIAEQRRYPLVSSHTNTGGLWTPDELKRLYGVGGFAAARVDAAATLPKTILSFRRYAAGGRAVGVGLGSDTGGFNALPQPAADAKTRPLKYPFNSFKGNLWCGREVTGRRTFDVNRDGVAHYGLMPDLLALVQRQKRGRAALGLLFHSADRYLRTWRRTGAR